MSELSRRVFTKGMVLSSLMVQSKLSLSLEQHSDFIPAPEESGYIATQGGNIWYRINGKEHFAKGKTPLLCLHGGPGSSHNYLLPLVDLAAERPVILYDQLDCGLSDRPGKKENWTVERFVSEIDSIREALNLSEIALYGNSCGATWIAPYASKIPNGLNAVIFGSPFLAAEPFVKDVNRLRKELPDEIRKVLEHHEEQGTTNSDEYHEAVFFWYKRHVCRVQPWPDHIMRTIELFSNDLYEYMWGPSEPKLTGTLSTFDVTEDLKRIKSPCWYVCGEFDEMTPKTTEAFSKLTPGAEFTSIKNASHTPHIEQRQEFMALASRFLERYADGSC